MSDKKVILAGDTGGTKTDLAIYSSDRGARRPLAEATFPSNNYASLDAIVHEFLAGKGVVVEHASFGIAGPIVGNRAQVTNLTWLVDGDVLSQTIGGAPVDLLNDLQAIAQGVPFLEPADLETLNVGIPQEHGALAIIAPGTGLGEGYLVWTGDRYTPYPSEGGHAGFAPAGNEQRELHAYLEARFGHVSKERVCSGMGMPNLYAFVRDTGRAPEPEWLRARLAAVADQTPIIVQTAIENKAEICCKTLDLFVSILASAAGSLALTLMATGGVYIGGGIPRRITPALRGPEFMSAFASKGRLSEIVLHVPVHVITKPNAGLFGAACHSLMARPAGE